MADSTIEIHRTPHQQPMPNPMPPNASNLIAKTVDRHGGDGQTIYRFEHYFFLGIESLH
jgi:hypothetical protein